MVPVLYCIVKNDSIYTPTETTVYERVTDGVEQEASISSHAIESYWTPWRNKHTDRQTPYVNGDSVPVFLLYLPRCFLEFSGVGNKNTIIVMVQCERGWKCQRETICWSCVWPLVVRLVHHCAGIDVTTESCLPSPLRPAIYAQRKDWVYRVLFFCTGMSGHGDCRRLVGGWHRGTESEKKGADRSTLDGYVNVLAKPRVPKEGEQSVFFRHDQHDISLLSFTCCTLRPASTRFVACSTYSVNKETTSARASWK